MSSSSSTTTTTTTTTEPTNYDHEDDGDEDEEEAEEEDEDEDFPDHDNDLDKSLPPPISHGSSSTTTTTTEAAEVVPTEEEPDRHHPPPFDMNGRRPPFDTNDISESTGIIRDSKASLPSSPRIVSLSSPLLLFLAVIGGAIVGLLCAILLVIFIVYRIRKKDESGSYVLDEPMYVR